MDLRQRDWAENPGFDAVIGNPPYVRQESFIEVQDYISQIYQTYSGRADIYVYFLERGLSLLAEHSLLSYIVSNKFIRANYGRNLRGYLVEHGAIKELIDFGDLPVFAGVVVYPCILVLQRLENDVRDANQVVFCKPREKSHDRFEDDVASLAYRVPQRLLHQDAWELEIPQVTELVRKINAQSEKVREFCGEPMRGILTGLNTVFLVKEEKMRGIVRPHPTDATLFKPYVRGRDIERWTPLRPQEYIIFTQGIDIDKYPAVKSYLEQFRQELETRTAVTTIGNKWFELHQIAGYRQQCEPKIVYPSVSDECRFTLNSDGTIVDKTCYFLRSESRYLLAILNSSLTLFLFRQLGAERRGGYLEFLGQYVEQLPIRRIAFTTPVEERARLLEEGRRLAAEWVGVWTTKDTKRHEKRERAFAPFVPFRDFRGPNAVRDPDFPRWLDERLSATHTPDPDLVCRHNADPLHKDWPLPEGGPAEQADVVHDLLAGLAEGMIAMNGEKQGLLRAFRLDLAGYLDEAQMDRLNRLYTPKKPPQPGDADYNRKQAAYDQALSTAQDHLGPLAGESLDLADFWRLTEAQWTWLLKARLAQVEHLSALVDVFARYHAQLAPLMGRLAATDALIDSIVYRLYGLTEEEVAVVEGK